MSERIDERDLKMCITSLDGFKRKLAWEVIGLRAENACLRKLKPYVQHKPECALGSINRIYGDGYAERLKADCTCGLGQLKGTT